MTEQQMQDQIEAIRRVGERALASKEASRQFLLEAGIITEEHIIKAERREKSKKKKSNS